MLSLLDVHYKNIPQPNFSMGKLRGEFKFFTLGGKNYSMISLDNLKDAFSPGSIHIMLALANGEIPEQETIIVETDEDFNIPNLQNYQEQADVWTHDLDQTEALMELVAKRNAK